MMWGYTSFVQVRPEFKINLTKTALVEIQFLNETYMPNSAILQNV